MRCNHRILALLGLALLLGFPASAQLSTTQIDLPPNPTTSDRITIKLSGTWPDSCIPANPRVALSGRLILVATSNAATACAQVLTPWSLSLSIGPLPAGTYQVVMTFNQQVIRSKVFTVSGESDSGQPLTADLTTDRGCLEDGQNPIYFPGEKIRIQIRIDGADQAVATIEDILPQGTRVIFRQTVTGNQTLNLPLGDVGPALGRQTLRLTAQAGDRIAQHSCSFTVVAPPTPAIDVSPASLDFGTVLVGSRGQGLLTVRNVGQGNLVVSGFQIQGGGFSFCSGTPSPVTLRSGEATQVAVCFTPLAAGTSQGAVVLQTNDPNEGFVTVSLIGRGLSVTPRSPDIDVSPTSLDFGTVNVGSSGQQLLTIRNFGQGTLIVNGFGIQGGGGSSFSFCGGTPSPVTLRSGEATQVAVCFAPLAEGTSLDAVVLRSNDPDEGFVTIPLSGRGVGVTPGLGTAQIEIVPSAPTPTDAIVVRLSGTWPTSCVPQNPQFSLSGSQILIATSNPGVACNPVQTSWSLSVPIGQLPAGAYRVSLTYNQQSLQQATFTVGSQVTPPAPQTLLVVTGSVPNAHLGAVVGGAGDANGDGRGDFLVGTEDFLTVVSGATGQPLYSIVAEAPGDFDHATAFSVRDLDGDGRDEIVVAAPLADPAGLVDAGALYVYSGATGQRLRLIPGDAPGSQFGASAALLGDLNGDGRPEVAVGAPGAGTGALAQAGSVTIVSLVDGAILRTFPGSVAGDRFGSAVAALDDLDGDGRPDLAVGAPMRDLAVGPDAGVVLFLSSADGRVLTTLEGGAPNMQLGRSLARAGDLNGDGRADLIIGGPGRAVGNLPGAGSVFVYSAAERRLLFQLDGAAAGDGFGTVVAGGGDVNGDGRPDVLVGAPLADVQDRPDAGLVQLFSGTDGTLLFSLAGNAGDRLGTAAAFAGDVNADQRSDVVVGAPFFDAPAGQDAGQALVVGLPIPPFQPVGP